MLLQSNTIFDNHYTLIRQLGRGGFSEVWLAHDSYMDIDVAIKIYAPGQGMDSNSINEFRREITGVFQLNHSNLLCPKHLGIWENMPYLIMAYCPAGSCLKFVGNISESEIWHLIHDVAAGLAYLHEKDIVHQDIKPDNILVDTEGNYLITDFGISTRARSTLRKSVIGGNTSGGTTAYMGPERFSREPAPTKASDIWSFGAMAFELLEGVTPFGEIGGGMQKGGAEIPFIKAPVSDALKYTIFKMLSKETWDRPTAATLIEWAKNPDAIEIDYSLLFEEGSGTQAQPASTSVVDTPATQLEGRATQRFNSVEPVADVNSTIPYSSNKIDNEPTFIASNEDKPAEKKKGRRWIWWILGPIALLVISIIFSIAYNEIKLHERKRIEQQQIEQQQIEEAERKEKQRRDELARQGYVDLGLPSGTLWKKENEGGNSAYYTYDEAVSKFGNKLPTIMHFTELIDKCKWTWTGSGYKIIGPNGNFIYLPAAGSRLTTGEVLSVGISGSYWSSTPCNSYYVNILYFYSGTYMTYGENRDFGKPVRLVCP